jgi:hypothetical protein
MLPCRRDIGAATIEMNDSVHVIWPTGVPGSMHADNTALRKRAGYTARWAKQIELCVSLRARLE